MSYNCHTVRDNISKDENFDCSPDTVEYNYTLFPF